MASAASTIAVTALILHRSFSRVPCSRRTLPLQSGGYVIWINRAFGPFAAHQNAIWNLVANAFDNALYPVRAVYLKRPRGKGPCPLDCLPPTAA